jgi:hypothetical protein
MSALTAIRVIAVVVLCFTVTPCNVRRFLGTVPRAPGDGAAGHGALQAARKNKPLSKPRCVKIGRLAIARLMPE